MKLARLGDVSIPALGLGCLSMHPFYSDPPPRDDAIKVIHHAYELGIRLLDTSDLYADGENELLIGEALSGRRHDFFISTKFGSFTGPDGKIHLNAQPDYVARACDASLRRLQTDVIDLYYLHRLDPMVPIEETVGAMSKLVQAGKVRFIGLSEVSAQTLRRAQSVHPIAALQTEYSLWSRDVEREILSVCEELNICFVAYAVLGRGFLTGQIASFDDLASDDRRRLLPRFQPENLAENLRLIDELKKIAVALDATPAQVATSWLLSRVPNIIGLIGTSRMARLIENAGAAQLTIPATILSALDDLFHPDAAAGSRYTPAQMARIQG